MNKRQTENDSTELDLFSFDGDALTFSSFQLELHGICSYQDAIKRLENELSQFEGNLRSAARAHRHIDTHLAIKLFEKSSALLRVCKKRSLQKYVPFALAAISYFVRSDDGKSDFEDKDGFEDDRQVLEYVIKRFELEDLVKKELTFIRENERRISA